MKVKHALILIFVLSVAFYLYILKSKAPLPQVAQPVQTVQPEIEAPPTQTRAIEQPRVDDQPNNFPTTEQKLTREQLIKRLHQRAGKTKGHLNSFLKNAKMSVDFQHPSIFYKGFSEVRPKAKGVKATLNKIFNIYIREFDRLNINGAKEHYLRKFDLASDDVNRPKIRPNPNNGLLNQTVYEFDKSNFFVLIFFGKHRYTGKTIVFEVHAAKFGRVEELYFNRVYQTLRALP